MCSVRPLSAAAQDKLLAAGHRVERAGRLILIFGNYAYRNIIHNWLRGAQRLGLTEVLLVSCDQPMGLVEPLGMGAEVVLPVAEDLASMWQLRVEVLAILIGQGIAVTHSDADAIWLQDPREYIAQQCPATDVVFSQGINWPVAVHRRMGFVLCCGFFQLLANRAVEQMLAEVLEETARVGDDQIAFNHWLIADHVVWKRLNWTSRFCRHERVFFLTNKRVLYSRSSRSGLQYALLPHHLFQRVHRPRHRAIVSHIFSAKQAESKEAQLRHLGQWYL